MDGLWSLHIHPRDILHIWSLVALDQLVLTLMNLSIEVEQEGERTLCAERTAMFGEI